MENREAGKVLRLSAFPPLRLSFGFTPRVISLGIRLRGVELNRKKNEQQITNDSEWVED